MNSNNKPKLEEISVYPAGRGKVLIIAKKSIPKKPKKTSQPRYTHSRIKSNPQDISLVEYLNNDQIKHIYMFPEGRQLNHEERTKLAAALIVTLPRYLGESNTMQTSRNPYFISKELRKEIKIQWRRYKKWRKKQI